MKKLNVIFLALIIFANCFNFSYIISATMFLNESIIKDAVWESLDKKEKKIIISSWEDIKIELINIDEISDLTQKKEDEKVNYKLSVFNGGFLAKVPIKILENGKEVQKNIYVNPFTNKLAGSSKKVI